MTFKNHVLQGVPLHLSPNMGGIIKPRFIVMHYTAGWTAASAIATLCNPAAKVSAQFVVDRDGSITQLVPCNRAAWHAGPSRFGDVKMLNNHSIGIEIVNPGYFKKGPGGQVLTPDGKPVPASRLVGYDLSFEAPHPRIGGGVYIWPKYTPAQYDALRKLVTALEEEYDIEDVLTHEQIDTRCWKTDTGPAFEIKQFKDIVHGKGGDGRQADTPMLGSAKVIARLNVRTSAVNGAVITVLPANTYVAVIRDVGDWCEVNYAPGKTGWVSQQYLRKA